MTENERVLRDIIIDGNGFDYDESIPQSIFEEIQQYRAIGTVEECEKAMDFELAKQDKMLAEVIDDYLKYIKIGTIEEFKALKEKNEQIPIIHGKAELELHDKGIRNKVIDEFAEKFIFKAVCEGCSGCCNCHEEGRQSECEDWKAYMEIAEEMRGAE